MSSSREGGKRGRETTTNQPTDTFATPELPVAQNGAARTAEEAGKQDPKDIDGSRSSLKWIRSLRRQLRADPGTADPCYYISDLNARCKDYGPECFTIREIDTYKGSLMRMLACAKVAVRRLLKTRSEQLSHLGRSNQYSMRAAEVEEDDVTRLKTFLLEADLTDNKSRHLDWRCQELYRLFVAFVSLQARSKKASELASVATSKQQLTDAQEVQLYTLDIVERGMLQAIAWQHDLRCHYVFNHEKLLVGLCSLNGCKPLMLRNSDYVSEDDIQAIRSGMLKPVGSPVGDFGERHGPFLANDLTSTPGGITRVSAMSSEFSERSKCVEYMSARAKLGINACARYLVEESKYTVIYEAHEAAEQRVTRIRMQNGFTVPVAQRFVGGGSRNYAHFSAIYDTEHQSEEFSKVAPVLLHNTPTTFFLVGAKDELMRSMNQLITLIEIAARTTVGFEGLAYHRLEPSDFCYLGKEHGTITASDFVFFKLPQELIETNGAAGKELVLAAMPCLVMRSIAAVLALAFGLCVRLNKIAPESAQWLYPSGTQIRPCLDKNFSRIYTAGYNFSAWGNCMRSMTFEFHPGFTFFKMEAKRVVDAHSNNSAHRVLHSFVPDASGCKKLVLKTVARFIDDYPQHTQIPKYTFLVPLEELDHSLVIPKTGVMADEEARMRGPHGCTFYACNLLSKECRSKCPLCVGDVDVVQLSSTKRRFMMLHYKDLAAWQYARSLFNVRNLLAQLDEEASIKNGTGSCATTEDLENWVKNTANLSSIWTQLKEVFMNQLKDLNAFHAQMLASYDKMHSAAFDRIKGIGRNGGPLQPGIVARVMADHIEDFCQDHIGIVTSRDSRTIRFGHSHSLSVFIGDENAGSYKNFKPPGDHGNVFDLVVRYVFNLTGTTSKEAKDRAVDFCHSWLVRTYGPGVFEASTGSNGAISGGDTAAVADSSALIKARDQDRKKKAEDAVKASQNEAHAIWLGARRITRPFYQNGFCSTPVNYLKNRGITSERILFDKNTFMRYHPACSVKEEGISYQSPALVLAVTDPKEEAKLKENEDAPIVGVHTVFLDASTDSKAVDLLHIQKKSRGQIAGHACRLQRLTPDTNLQREALKNYGALIAVGEGPETMLSVAECCPEIAVYCTFSIVNIPNFPYIGNEPWGSAIIYCADNDKGKTAMEQAEKDEARMKNVRALCAKGYTVLLSMPQLLQGRSKTDFNDLLTGIKDRDAAEMKIQSVISSASIHPPTSPNPSEVKAVELTEDGSHIKEMPKKIAQEKDDRKRKAMLLDAMRKKHGHGGGHEKKKKDEDEEPAKKQPDDDNNHEMTEAKQVKKKKDEPKKKKAEESSSSDDSSSSSSSSSSSASSSSSSSSEEEEGKSPSKSDNDGAKEHGDEKEKKKPNGKKKDERPSSSSSEDSESSSSSDGEGSEKVKLKKKPKANGVTKKPKSKADSDDDDDDDDKKKETEEQAPKEKKARLLKKSVLSSSSLNNGTTDIVITDSAQGSASSPSSPSSAVVGDDAQVLKDAAGAPLQHQKRPRVLEDDDP